jgi:hypothetical protein
VTIRALLVYPGSLFGGEWAAGPRLKPELVTLWTELRRAGLEVEVLDLEAELGLPRDDAGRAAFLADAERLLGAGPSAGPVAPAAGPDGSDDRAAESAHRPAEQRAEPAHRPADLALISCWSALQYSAGVAVAERLRRLHPAMVIAAHGHHVSARPEDFTYEGSPFNWLIVGEAEMAALELARTVAAGDRDVSSCRPLEGMPLPLDAAHLPDIAGYSYARPGLPEVAVSLSRGCPYNAPACLLRPGGAGWHAYPPDAAAALLEQAAALEPTRIDVLDPAFGYDPVWRRATFERLTHADRRGVVVSLAARPEALARLDLDRLYHARAELRLDVGTLSWRLLRRTGEAADPRQAVAHAVDLLTYANAKGVVTVVSFTFNRPGETEETAAETLDELETLIGALPNTSLRLQASSWAYQPSGDLEADLETPRRRFGSEIVHPEWWREPLPSREAATAVVASAELAGRPPGDESHWRPRFDELAARLEAKLTAEARRGLRSHESVGSEACGVPHGWLSEPRWH